MSQNEVEELEIEIEVANKIRAMRDNCVTMMDSPAYKDIIEEGYFKEEAARLVMAKSAPLKPEQMQLIDNMILGVGALQNFLNSIMRRGNDMDRAVQEAEATREDLLQEGANL